VTLGVKALTNPAVTGAYTLAVVTSADTAPAVSSYCLAASSAAPCLSATSVSTGRAGTAVTLQGTNLSGAQTVSFSGTAAPIGTVSATAVATMVPDGAQSGPVMVTTPAGSASSPGSFTVISAVTDLSVTAGTPSASAGALTAYQVGFVTSPQGALRPGGTVTITLPAGTSLGGLAPVPLEDAGVAVGVCAGSAGTVVTCTVGAGQAVAAGDALSVDLAGVGNPPTPRAYSLVVTTSADAIPTTSTRYQVLAVTRVLAPTVTPGSTTAGATGVDYRATFKAASGLSGAVGSTVTVELPPGTGVGPGLGTVTDGGTVVATCSAAGAPTFTCALPPGAVAAAGDQLTVGLTGLANPAATWALTAQLWTSSDTRAATVPYCVAVPGTPCIAAVYPVAAAVGSTVTVTGVNLSTAIGATIGGTAATITRRAPGSVAVVVPAGAVSGPLTVSTPGGTSTAPVAFTVR
jgi:hypothetical protein